MAASVIICLYIGQWIGLKFGSENLGALFGTLFGLILGVLPGLGPTTGGALILPFTMTLDPLSAIVLLTSIYCAGTYGGAITAVLILSLIHISEPTRLLSIS